MAGNARFPEIADPGATPSAPRQLADQVVATVCAHDPASAELIGMGDAEAVPDYSPDGIAAFTAALRRHRAELDAVASPAADDGALPAEEFRAARLLRERLDAYLLRHASDDNLANLNNLASPVPQLQLMLTLSERGTEDDWARFSRRLARVPGAIRGHRAALDAGLAAGQAAAPRQVRAVIDQLEQLPGWFHKTVESGPEPLSRDLTAAATDCAEAADELRNYLRDRYLPAADGTPDAVGAERYRRHARFFTGADLDLDEAYAYGWEEFLRIRRELTAVAEEVLPGAGSPRAAMDHLDAHGHAVEGAENIRVWLQEFLDRSVEYFDGTHFDLADRVKVVESMIAPPGGAGAPHYTAPSRDFSRPGRTWLPTLGETRFPTWSLVTTWYHEGVPGHHLQLAQWQHVADRLSTFQTTVGQVSANTEGWALYAERFADELGLFADPAHRLGYLAEQMLRAIRVIIDIGMHLRLRIPSAVDFHAGETWTPELADAFLAEYCAMTPALRESELTRYLGLPGQAIGYKLGERAWLAGREAARLNHAAQGREFVLKDWHMAALSAGSLGLDDLQGELAKLP